MQPDIHNSILYGKTLAAAHTAPLLLVLIAKHIETYQIRTTLYLKIFYSTGLAGVFFVLKCTKKGRKTNSCLKALYD